MGFNPLSWLKSSDKAVDAGIGLLNNGQKAIDALFYTDEEKSENAKKVMNGLVEYWKTKADENSVRSKARRVLAFGIIGNFLLLLDTSAVLEILNHHARAKAVFDIAVAESFMVGAATIFYFGYYGVQGIIKKAKGK